MAHALSECSIFSSGFSSGLILAVCLGLLCLAPSVFRLTEPASLSPMKKTIPTTSCFHHRDGIFLHGMIYITHVCCVPHSTLGKLNLGTLV